MTYNLNLIPGKVPVAVHVKQYDTGLREITFNLYYGDTEYSVPYNSTITVSGTKPDGNGFSYSVTFSGSAVTVPMQEQMTVLAGEFPCQLTIANSGEIIGTASFLLCVEPAALSSDTPVSDTDLAMFQQLANQTQTEAAGVANATAQIAANTQNIATNTEAISDVNALLGNTGMGTTATTVTGAIAEHESDITALNSKTATSSGSGLSNKVRWYSFGRVCHLTFYGISTDTTISNLGIPTPAYYATVMLINGSSVVGYAEYASSGWSLHAIGSGTYNGYGTGCFVTAS